jgi:hypothetical protein
MPMLHLQKRRKPQSGVDLYGEQETSKIGSPRLADNLRLRYLVDGSVSLFQSLLEGLRWLL